MTRRITGDQNNISSKLLGANLADINIEKFRDLNTYKKSKYELQGKLSMPILKAITNKFSPSVIFTIVLPYQAISKIDALSQCQNTVILNLSGNAIQDLAPLANMKQLKMVDISDNSVAIVDCFQNFEQLVNVKLEGNMIKSTDSIKALKTCARLKNLHLQTLGGDKANPICQLQNYRNNVLSFLDQISRLDSIPKGMQLNNGSELKNNNKKQLKIQLKNIGPFYCAKFPNVTPYIVSSFPGQAPLKKSISDCKSILNQLEIRMKAAMAL